MSARSYLGELIGRQAKQISRDGIYPFLDEQMQALPPSSRVLSIGSSGEIGDRIVSWRARGLEIVTLDIQASRKPDIVADLCEWRDEGAFDAIFCSEVLEHVWAPHIAVDNMFASLKPGGRLVLTAPFLFPIHGAPYDYFRYTRYGLEVLLKKFTETTILDRNSWTEALGVLAIRLSRKQKVLAAAIVPMVAAAYPLLQAIGKSMPMGTIPTGYNVVAVK